MDEKEYIEQRLEDQIAYYDRASMRSQCKYKYLKITEIMCAACVPVGIGLAELVGQTPFWPAFFRGLAALLGASVAIVSGVMAVCKFQENWLAYRTTCEMLRHEKYFYETGCGHYKGVTDKLCLLVSNVEDLISQENTNWRKHMESTGKKANDG